MTEAVAVEVSKLLAYSSPLESDVWGCGIVSVEMVQKCLDEGNLMDHEKWEALNAPALFIPSAKDHAARIAFLVVDGWDEPIQLDVGIPSMGYAPAWPYLDGNHRAVAAAIRGDDIIYAHISGQVDYANTVLGVSI